MGGVDDFTAREGDYNCKIKDHKKKKTKHLHWLAAPADWQQPVLLEPTTTSSNSSCSKSRTSSSWRSSSCSSRSSISRNTRKSTPQILAFSPPAVCCPVCALAFNGGALCAFYYKYVHFACYVVRCVLCVALLCILLCVRLTPAVCCVCTFTGGCS